MSIFKIAGLAEASGEVFPTVPAGTYQARIIKVEDKQSGPNSKVPGSPMLVCTVLLTDEKAQGQHLFMNIMMPTDDMEQDKKMMSINRVKRIAIACNIQVTDDFDTGDLMGGEFKAVVALEQKEGQPKKNNIVDQLPL